MLGYIYVFTNKLFPNNMLNIQISRFDKSTFSRELNKHYLDPIKIIIQQPTANIIEAEKYLSNILNKYKFNENSNFFRINLQKINYILLNMTIKHSKNKKFLIIK